MAGKGGGAWKVAYADFVTAMMAFFLVMWIMSQDKKLKRAVAHYFSDPAGFTITGNSSAPTSSGALFQSDVQGNVPDLDNQLMGRGSAAYAEHGGLDRRTQMVSDWLRHDPPSHKYWRAQAEQQRRLAGESPLVKDEVWTAAEAAAVQLAQQMKEELAASAPRHGSGFYDELLDASLADVNWRGLAEEYLTE
jgi:flagellar motor protein MotB